MCQGYSLCWPRIIQKYEFTGTLFSKAFEDDTAVYAFFFLGIRVGLTMGEPSVGLSDSRMECNPTVCRKSVVREAIT